MAQLKLIPSSVCITSIIRLSTINRLSLTDQSWSYVPAAIWTSVECSVAVISACLPTMKPLFRTIFDLTDALPFEAPRKASGDDSECGVSRNPSPDRVRQWRAHANAQRICELGEFKSEEHRSAKISPTLCDETRGRNASGDSDPEKRWDRNFSRPWMGFKTSYKDSKAAIHKTSDDNMVLRNCQGVHLAEKMLSPPPRDEVRAERSRSLDNDGRGARGPKLK